ncbi:hypothetical protein [Halomonas sp. BC04]|uniref:hypothetical protein n=1 Tax=Halomonas sp. BC04 TaxID=1403540 RepID=UPI0003ED66E7|nr:hypothetical protein [Halomonas sp. BC04]EWG98623.1 hypothetical protein Q427_29395 [Halomonas sp. BC04]
MHTATYHSRSAPPRSLAVTGIALGFIAFSLLILALMTLPLLPGDAIVASLASRPAAAG